VAQDPNPEYNLAELAQRSGVSARTIRYYQSVGLLPKPVRRREAVYGPHHEERLQLIASMRARGLRLDAIRAVIEGDGSTRDAMAEWLDLAINYGPGPWSDHRERCVDDADLTRLLGERRAEILDDLVAEHYVRYEDGRWHIPDFPMFKGALLLSDLGVTIPVAARMRRLIRDHTHRLADDLVGVLVTEAGRGYAGDATTADLQLNLDRFRPAAWETVGYAIAQEIARAVTETGND
jgi:DNA-binding transcriptional MerR regulator